MAQDNLEKIGIENQSLFWSLGIFAVVLILLGLLFAFYYLVLYLRRKIPGLSVVEKYLKKKLFHNGIIRYMIQSNLKLAHTAAFFLAIKGISFQSKFNAVNSILNIIILVVLFIWPVFLFSFLMLNRRNLEKPSFKEKFDSMFLGIKTDKYLTYKWDSGLKLRKAKCFLYNVVFVARRMAFVACSLSIL